LQPAEPTAEIPEAQPLPAEVPFASGEVATVALAELIQSHSDSLPPDRLVKVLVTPTASRRLAESLVLFISAILFLRSLAVEPFGVPTGSMAPALIGNHKSVACPRCGHPVNIGEPGKQNPNYPKATCPNCGKTDIELVGAIELAGDRLLVDKNVYTLRSPRRWEPAVFRCPSDLSKPYVKRVVGLPGEKVQVINGDVYIDGRLARKSLVEALETRVPIFDMNFPPQPEGWAKRWVVENKLPPDAPDQNSDPGLALAGKELLLDGTWATRVPVWIAYKHHRYDDATQTDKEEMIRDRFIYNGVHSDTGSMAVHDFVAEFEVEVLAGSGQLLCRMWDGADTMIAACPVGQSPPEAQLRHDGFGIVRTGERKPLEAGGKYRIRMAFVDRRVSFSVNGKQPFSSYDLDAAKTRVDVTSPVALGVQGINVVIRDLKISRDIYYRSSGRNAIEEAYMLGADEYFMLGDNSANSDDSRSWPIPGVPERNFLGKPFLLHQPSRVTRLTINGRERTFQSIDWSRIRLLR